MIGTHIRVPTIFYQAKTKPKPSKNHTQVMANTPNNDDKSAIEEVNDSLTGVGVKIQNNPKVIVYACVGVAIIVAIVLIWIYAVRHPPLTDKGIPPVHNISVWNNHRTF